MSQHCPLTIIHYFKAHQNKEPILDLDVKQSFFLCDDAGFYEHWFMTTARDDLSTAKYITGYIITYAICPNFWFPVDKSTICLLWAAAEDQENKNLGGICFEECEKWILEMMQPRP
eukprot:4902629-Ditylum_brightwellii.AAC.1